MALLELYHYWVFAVLLMIGFYAVIAKLNLIKKLIGLSLFQAAVFLLYITMGKVNGVQAFDELDLRLQPAGERCRQPRAAILAALATEHENLVHAKVHIL